MIVDDYGMFADRHEVRRELDKSWNVSENANEDSVDELNPDTWGTSESAHMANMEAMRIADVS